MPDLDITNIVVAIIGFAGVVYTQVATNRRTTKDLLDKISRQSELQDAKLDAKLDKMQAVTDTKITELTREVREHNNFAHRLPVVEEKVSTLEREIKEVKQH